MNRLHSANCSDDYYDLTFTYDNDGNFITKNRPGANYTYNYTIGTNANNKLNSITGFFSYAYDLKGNLTEKKNSSNINIFTASSYDFRNLPLTVWDTNAGTTTYKYDDAGNRIVKKVGTGSVTNEYYLRDHTGKEVAIYDLNTDKIKMVNLFGIGQIGNVKATWSGSTRTDERYYYVNDHLGTVRLVIDENSEVSSAKDYYAYGGVAREINYGTEEKYDYTGKERDTESGLNYFGARYYGSDEGRWLSVDPLADLFPEHSPYSYAFNNPLRYVDILGLAPTDSVNDASTIVYELPLITVVGRTAVNVLSRLGGILSLVTLSVEIQILNKENCIMKILQIRKLLKVLLKDQSLSILIS
ncbi:MAG: RHS repeat-associated core domain-containing protein [Melioribacteraceae bacterium]